jgi:hypothetical protein
VAQLLNSKDNNHHTVRFKILLIIAFVLTAGYLFGQEQQLEPDRPSESRSSELVKGNNLQAELGFRKEKIESGQYMFAHPQATLRYGLFNALELRMQLVSQTLKNNISKENSTGLAPVYFGVKAKILPQYKWLPSIGALAQVGLPSFASSEFFVTGIPFEFRTMFNHNVNSKFAFQYNFGVAWNETDQKKDNKQWMYTFSPILKASDNLHFFIEEYAFLRNGTSAEHYFDGGVVYFVNKNFEVDLSAGAGLSEISSSYFLEAGFAYRIPFGK